MAKKVNKDKKLKALKDSRNANLFLSVMGAGYGGIKGREFGRDKAIDKQHKSVKNRIEELGNKIKRGEELTEQEAKFMYNPKPVMDKILEIIPKSPRTKKYKTVGTAVGAAALGIPTLIAAGFDQHKINKLKKEIKKEKKEASEKTYSIMSKEFSSKEERISDEELSKMSRNQILKLLDKRADKVDRDKEEYVRKKTRRGGIIGSILSGLGTAAVVGLGSKYAGTSTKESLIRAALSGSAAAGYGYMKGRKVAKDNAEDYAKVANEFNKEKVTKKYAKDLDKKMRDLGKEDDLEAINDERYKNEKKAKREYDDYLKHNSVLNLGRNSIRVR